MIKLVGLGLGAGIVSALLFAVVATGSPAGMVLSYAAPLPIIIVALGWHHLVGLLAAAIGALALSIGLRSSAGIAFALGPALPAWCLAYLALLARPGRPEASGAGPEAMPALSWLTVGRLLFWTGVAGGFIALAAAVGLGGGDYGQFRTTLNRVTETLLRLELQGGAGRPPGADAPPSGLVSVLVAIAPAVAGCVFSVALALNLWLAGKVVALSGRLPRPWPRARDARMDVTALGAFAAAILLAFGPGFLGVGGRALAGGLAMMFALQGLGLLHLATRGRSGRTALLTLAYILAIFFGGTFLPLLALAGMVDTATSFRRRFHEPPDNGPPRGGPQHPPTPHT